MKIQGQQWDFIGEVGSTHTKLYFVRDRGTIESRGRDGAGRRFCIPILDHVKSYPEATRAVYLRYGEGVPRGGGTWDMKWTSRARRVLGSLLQS